MQKRKRTNTGELFFGIGFRNGHGCCKVTREVSVKLILDVNKEETYKK